MEEDLTDLLEKFTLTEAEQDELEVEEEEVEEISLKGNQCLVGKLISERIVGKDYIRKTMIRGWKPRETLSFKVLGENIFLIDFEDQWDKTRVLEGRPWSCDGQLFAVEEYDGLTPPEKMKFDSASFWVRMYHHPLSCMGKEIGFKLRATIGVVEDVDTGEDGIGWGQYLRVKAQVNVFKPLPRGRFLKLKNKTLWIDFKYEKIPKFCFKCGVICHRAEGCVNEVQRWKNGRGQVNKYGPWLRVGTPWRKTGASKGRYDEDGFFKTEESPPGRLDGREITQESSEGNWRYTQRDSQCNQEGNSGTSGIKTGAETEKSIYGGNANSFMSGMEKTRKRDYWWENKEGHLLS
jgi:hypothetical protein